MSKHNKIDTDSPFGTWRRHGLARLVWTFCEARVFSAPTRRWLRKRFARRFAGPFDVKFAGINWRLYPEENYCDRVIFARRNLPERAEHEILDAHLQPGMTFVDIGANIGSYSLYVSKLTGHSAQILALEPHPGTFLKLRYNLDANGAANVIALNIGSGSERTKMQLWSDGGSNIGHTSMLKAGTSNPKISVEVPVVPLAEILAEHQVERVDLLKIDIEGFEDRVLAPFFRQAAPTLWPHRLLIETAHRDLWREDVVGWMMDEGYRLLFQTEENLLLERHLHEKAGESDE